MASIKNWFWDKIISSTIDKLAKNPDLQTTVLGFILAALIAASVDWAKVLAGDSQAIGTVIAAVVVGLLGWRTNKKKANLTAISKPK